MCGKPEEGTRHECVLKGENLTLGYASHALFHDLSFEVIRGEITAMKSVGETAS